MKKLLFLTAVLTVLVCFFPFSPSAHATFTLVTQQALGVAPEDVRGIPGSVYTCTGTGSIIKRNSDHCGDVLGHPTTRFLHEMACGNGAMVEKINRMQEPVRLACRLSKQWQLSGVQMMC
jgi:hypothetical protein